MTFLMFVAFLASAVTGGALGFGIVYSTRVIFGLSRMGASIVEAIIYVAIIAAAYFLIRWIKRRFDNEQF